MIDEEYYQAMKDNLEAYKVAIESIKEILEDLENELKSNVG